MVETKTPFLIFAKAKIRENSLTFREISFRENFRFRESFCKNYRFRETFCEHENFCETFRENENFRNLFSRKAKKISRKCENENFRFNLTTK
jgi:hypothetical protein